MTLPRLAMMKRFWKDNPPVRMMIQAKFGMTPKQEEKTDDDAFITDAEQAFLMLPDIANKLGGGLARNG